MNTLTKMMSVAVLSLTAATGWSAIYKEPLPTNMLPYRTFLDGYTATGIAGSFSPSNIWTAVTSDAHGNPVQELQMYPGWSAGPASLWAQGAAVQWSGVNFTSTGTQEVWMSCIVVADQAGKTISYTLSAGPDAANLTTRGTYNLTTAAYSTAINWFKIGNNWNFNTTDTVVRLTLATDNTYLLNDLGIDELVIAVPEPASLGLLALGGLALLRRRR